MAAAQPETPAMYLPDGWEGGGQLRYRAISFAQLDRDSNEIAAGLQGLGLQKGSRVALMVPPGEAFFGVTFALFKVGLVPILIDPGIGLKALKTCLAEAQPEAFIGIPKAQIARLLFGWCRGQLKHVVTVGPRLFWGGTTLKAIQQKGAAAGPYVAPEVGGDDPAAVLFTSGSTGIPKGALYRHRNFMAQVAMIRDRYQIEPGEVDLPTFPLFALFDPALGMTAVIPKMDFTRPAKADPVLLAQAIERFQCTNMFGSPALLNTFSRWGEPAGKKFPSLRRILSAGAPVPAAVLSRCRAMIPEDATISTPYGATESLPVASIESREVLGETGAKTAQGKGVCVGLPDPKAKVRIIKISDHAIESWSDDLLVGEGEIGEIVVNSPAVTTEYFGRPEQTALAKIRDVDGSVIHRMGDLGSLDEAGRLWFCGRKSHRLETAQGLMYTLCCEGVFNDHPQVFRTALVGTGERGAQEPVLLVERELEVSGPRLSAAELTAELLELGSRWSHTRAIEKVIYHPGFPVDIRHNAKINREQLSRWAEQRL